MDKELLQSTLKTGLLAIIIIAIGIFIVNQYIELTYSVHLIKEPCSVCMYDHPEIKLCKEITPQVTDNKININWSEGLSFPKN